MHIHIAKVNGILYEGEGDSLTAPATEGEVTILAHHVPLVTTLKSGRLVVKQAGTELFTHDVLTGVLEVTAEGVTVLL